jgi:KRAB domain-containing zinc finger protein
MTNTKQPILDSIVELIREEIQLTELKPVEQSRIKKTVNDKDGNATDGLRALRSFSHQQIDELEHFKTVDYPKKRRADKWDLLNSTNKLKLKCENENWVEQVNNFQCNDEARKSKIEDDVQSDELEEDEEDEFYGINGDFEYLEERNDEEIYVYRQRDSCSNSEIDKSSKSITKKVTIEKLVDRKINKKSQKIQFQSDAKPRPRGRPRKNLTITKNTHKLPKTKVSNFTDEYLDQSEKELQNKINDIIQANYLMEQENNNIVDSSHSKVKNKELCKDKHIEDQLKKYCCLICKARFKGSGGLRNHYKVMHASGPLFKCNECGKEFPLKERLKLHVRTHTGFKPYKCSDCDKSFARGGQLVQHRRTHNQVKPYSCHLCSGTFTCAANLALHVKRHNGQKDHKCDICGRGFVRRDALKKHLECLHRDVKSFLCVICNKTFKGHLPQHMRTHAKDRPHGCATCGQRFAQKSQLTVHQRTHSGQRPFRCLVCWQAFAHSTALKLHTRRHTGERPFKCAECNAGFTQLPHWKKHMKCIHGRNDPYCCRKCNNFFRIKNDLEAHEKDCQVEYNNDSTGSDPGNSRDEHDGISVIAMTRYRSMSIEKMRLLLAVLLKRISKPDKLDELGFGKRLIDEVLIDSLVSAGKEIVKANGVTSEFEALRKNLAAFLQWTVPKEHWDNFRKMKKTPEEVLETLTAT